MIDEVNKRIGDWNMTAIIFDSNGLGTLNWSLNDVCAFINIFLAILVGSNLGGNYELGIVLIFVGARDIIDVNLFLR